MSKLPTYHALRARFDDHHAATFAGHPGQEHAAVVAALQAIGWRADGDHAVGLVASLAESIIEACAHGHRDVAMTARDLADLMRQYAPRHNDFLASIEDFIPAAEEVLHFYVEGVGDSDIIRPPV